MWKLVYVSCSDFISFKSAEIDIPQNVCSLVYGLNNDNVQQRNNGTGKSSIIEAIAFALTGEPLRAVDKAEEIINDHSDSANVFVELENDYDNTVFTIERTLSRKAAQVIACHKYDREDDGTLDEIEKEQTSQPTVIDYNRYILEEIGLSKEDIYSNFILSNNRYKSFFDASDKTKKAIINRFSGADAIDGAIERLKADEEPIKQELEEAKNNVIAIEAKLEVICNQIDEINTKKSEWLQEKQERIEELNNKISQKRGAIRNNKELIAQTNKRLDDIDEESVSIEDMQDDDVSLQEAHNKIDTIFSKYELPKIKDYVSVGASIADSISEIQMKQDTLKMGLTRLQKRVGTCNSHFDKVKEKHSTFQSEAFQLNNEDELNLQSIASDINKSQAKIDKGLSKLNELKDKADDIDSSIRGLLNQLHGVIVCPKCKHEFFLNAEQSVETVKEQLADRKQAHDEINKQIVALEQELQNHKEEKNKAEQTKSNITREIGRRNDKLHELAKELDEALLAVENALREMTDSERSINRLRETIYFKQDEMNNLMRQMLSDALNVIDDEITKGERYVKTLEEDNVAANAAIESFENTIESVRNASQSDLVASLGNSKVKYEKELQSANKSLSDIQKKYGKYVEQETHFADFRSYLANKKVEAIAGVTNHFLELIGSDLRVEMLGYKKLKSGKIRDKISVNILRNGVSCGSYAKFSGGERARVNLASILGLQRLINNSAPKGKGLGLLILDEILDCSDTSGIESSCKALNNLKVTSLLVTQNPISDNDGNTITIVKENGYSTISIIKG